MQRFFLMLAFANAQCGYLAASGHPCTLSLLECATSPACSQPHVAGTGVGHGAGCSIGPAPSASLGVGRTQESQLPATLGPAPACTLVGPEVTKWEAPEGSLHAAFTLQALATLAVSAVCDAWQGGRSGLNLSLIDVVAALLVTHPFPHPHSSWRGTQFHCTFGCGG